MSFGEEYQGMSDREILVEIAGKIKGIKAQVDAIHCPQKLCEVHEEAIGDLSARLAEQERIENERKEAEEKAAEEAEGAETQKTERILSRNEMIVTIVGSVVSSGILVFVLDHIHIGGL